MLPLPRILIIDDQWGRARNRQNRERVNFCRTTGLRDITEAPNYVEAEPMVQAVAEAVFCSGQIEMDGALCNSMEQVLGAIRAGWDVSDRWALVLLDMCFVSGALNDNGEPQGKPGERDPKGYFGLEIIDAVRGSVDLSDLPLVAFSSMDRAPIEQDFGTFVRRFCDKSELSSPAAIQGLLDRNGLIRSERIIGASLPLLKVLREARSFGRSNRSCVLIQGERGTGKELLARYVHDCSTRKDGPYITEHCGALARDLLESELFGHEKGAFTGAITQKQGIFERADGGTVLLDEIGTMQHDAQVKLLRVLQEGSFSRVGGTTPLNVDVQVVAATNAVLKESVEQGIFSPDLFDRLRGDSPLYLPPLRDRLDDIPLLAEYFVRRAERERGARQRTMTKSALDLLCSYSWPGNVRQLDNVISNAVEWDNAYLLPEHLNLPRNIFPSFDAKHEPAMTSIADGTRSPETTPPNFDAQFSLDKIETFLNNFSFDNLRKSDLYGKMEAFERVMAMFKARYFSAVLRETALHTPANPDGEISFTRAVKHSFRTPPASTHGCADIVRKLIGVKGKKSLTENQMTLLQDPLLAQAFQDACRQRQKNKKQSDNPDKFK